MLRKAFLMEVQAGRIAAYTQSHNPIWPELEAVLREHGMRNYSIFHDPESNLLFGYVEVEDETLFARLPQNPVCRRWWKAMQAHLVSDDPASGKAREKPLREVFHLD